MSIKPIPDGFHAITPYLFAQGASRLIEFISAAFDGELTFRQTRPDGAIMHATMRIRDSILMLADPTPEFGPMPSSIYLYVTDCDTVYQRALRSGGISVFPMMTLPSGQRYGGVKDSLRQHLVGCHAGRGYSTRRTGTALEGIQNATT